MIGKTILHYKILEKLGEGGMGVVYKAEDTKLERTVAIKFLPHHIAANSEERERFKIEAKAAAGVNHPNIATIFAIEEHDDEMFIVMEYIEGQELREIVGAGFKPAPTPTKRHGLPEIVRGFKTFSARRINESRRTPGEPVWQRNYYDRIIRDDELNRIREYIIDNPLKWDLDKDNPENWNSHTKNSLGELKLGRLSNLSIMNHNLGGNKPWQKIQ